MGATSVIDKAAIEGILYLQKQTGSPLLQKIVASYLQEATAKLTEIAAAIDSADSESLRKSAHGLKSASGNVGASQVREICKQLEQHQQLQLDNSAISELYKQLPPAFKRASAELQVILESQ